MTGTIITNKFLFYVYNYNNIRLSVDLCTSIYEIERKRWNSNVAMLDEKEKEVAENKDESDVKIA